jgi:hypothetical protein
MEKEVKIYAYRLSFADGNVKVEEIVFTAIEKQKTFILKQDGDNTTKRVVYNLNAPIEDGIVSEKRDNFMRGRRTLRKDELEELAVSLYKDTRYIYYREPSLEKAMSVFKRYLEARVKGFKSEIESLTTKIKVCEGFVADVEI